MQTIKHLSAGIGLISCVQKKASPTDFAPLLLSAHKPGRRMQTKLCPIISIRTVDVKHRLYKLLSQMVLHTKSTVCKVPVTQIYEMQRNWPSCAWELFSHRSPWKTSQLCLISSHNSLFINTETEVVPKYAVPVM